MNTRTAWVITFWEMKIKNRQRLIILDSLQAPILRNNHWTTSTKFLRWHLFSQHQLKMLAAKDKQENIKERARRMSYQETRQIIFSRIWNLNNKLHIKVLLRVDCSINFKFKLKISKTWLNFKISNQMPKILIGSGL